MTGDLLISMAMLQRNPDLVFEFNDYIAKILVGALFAPYDSQDDYSCDLICTLCTLHNFSHLYYMPKGQTTKGKFCSPAANQKRKGGESCYTKDQLLSIAKAYNQQYSATIPLSGTKVQLWQSIEDRMDQCDSEWCWLNRVPSLSDELSSVFRAQRPPGKYQWLSTSDIREVLKQYEAVYPNFVFLGPVPMDFCNLAANEVCNLNLKRSKANGKTKIGIVFNTDPSSKPGKHWISMFIDISSNNEAEWEIGYFDSYGEAPLAPEVVNLIDLLKKQNPKFQLHMNCRNDGNGPALCTATKRHQLNNSECGVYSINYIVERLTGRPWHDIVHNVVRDEEMVEKRKHYFRPTQGGRH